MPSFDITIDEEMEQERLDHCLCRLFPEKSRSFLQNLIKSGMVDVGGKTASKCGYPVYGGDKIRLEIPKAREAEIKAEEIPLDILYEDDDLLVVNKPKGMVVHPAAGHENATLVNALMYHCAGSLSGINGMLRPGIVHRIDKDTSGALIVCKNDAAHTNIAEQIKAHSIERMYDGMVRGNLPKDEGSIRGAIGRHPSKRKQMAIVKAGGREAVTHYKVIERFKEYTYTAFRLETGRTHQIRVHMASIGHPLAGDPLYGGKSAESSICGINCGGQMLHAKTIGFAHPKSGEYIECNAPLPEYFCKILAKLRENMTIV